MILVARLPQPVCRDSKYGSNFSPTKGARHGHGLTDRTTRTRSNARRMRRKL